MGVCVRSKLNAILCISYWKCQAGGVRVLLDTTVFLLMELLLVSFALKAYCRLVFGLLKTYEKTNNSQCEFFGKG